MAGKRQIRTLRMKCKQIVLLEGHPDCLFEEWETINYWLKVNGKRYNLGKLGKKIAIYLKTLGAEIEEQHKTYQRPCGIPGFVGLIVRKSGANTTMQISAPTEEILQAQVSGVAEYLSKNDIKLTERCHWVCTFDKAKDDRNNESSTSEIHIGYSNGCKCKECEEFRLLSSEKERKRVVVKNGVAAVVKLPEMKPKTKELQELAKRLGVK